MASFFSDAHRLRESFAHGITSMRRLGGTVALLACFAIPRSAAAQNTGTLVNFDFGAFGSVKVDLFDGLEQATVLNFLQNYALPGLYNGTIIHRSDQLAPPGVPVGAIYGGGFSVTSTSIIPVQTVAPINLLYSRANTAGTIAMRRDDTDPNSATSQWFFNAANNSAALAPGGTTPDGYAVFGWIVGPGKSTINGIAALPTFDMSLGNSDFGKVPLHDITKQQFDDGADPIQHVITLNSVTVLKTHPAFQNPFLATDVNNDGLLTPADLGITLDDLNVHGVHPISTAFSGTNYLDVYADGRVSPFDVAKILDAFAIAAASPGAVSLAAPFAEPQIMAMPMAARSMAIVPEPSSLALVAAGILALGGYALRRGLRSRNARSPRRLS